MKLLERAIVPIMTVMLAFLICCFLSTPAMAQAKSADSVQVTIHVQRADNGNPIDRATVYIDKGIVSFGLSYHRKGSTNENGDAVFSVDAAYCKTGCYVTIQKDGFINATPIFHLDDDQPLKVALRPQGNTVEVKLHVQRADNGNPIEGATVYVDQRIVSLGSFAKYTDSTNENGNVVLNVDPAYCKSGCYATVHKDGFITATPLFHLDDPQPVTVQLSSQAITVNFHVTVEGDRTQNVEGAYIKFPPSDGGVDITAGDTRSPHSTTGRDGMAQITLDPTKYAGHAEATITRSGFETKKQWAQWQESLMSGTVQVDVSLKKVPGINVTVTVKDDKGEPLTDARVVLKGPTLDDFVAGTTQGGSVTLFITHGGSYELEISHSGFEDLSDKATIINVYSGDTTQELGPYTLTKKTAGMNRFAYDVDVWGKDEDGKEVAIEAEFSFSSNVIGLSVAGDHGHYTLKGLAAFQDTVEVRASAQGYQSQKQSFAMTQPTTGGGPLGMGAQSGTLTFHLERVAPTEVDLQVEVKDGDTPIEGARVTVQAIKPGAPESSTAVTGSDGIARIKAPIASLRQGLRAIARGDDFDDAMQDVPANFADQPHPLFTLFVTRGMKSDERDALRKAIEGLEAKVNAFFDDVAQLSRATNFLKQLSDAQSKAEALSKEIESAGGAFGTVVVPGFAGERCQKVGQLQQDIRTAETEAKQKAKELKELLDAANVVAANCSSAKDAEIIESKYRDAIKLAGEIGVQEKKAVNARNDLLALSKEMEALKSTLKEVRSKVAEIESLSDTAADTFSKGDARFRQLFTLSQGLPARLDALYSEVNALKVTYKVETLKAPSELKDRIDVMLSRLGKEYADVRIGADPRNARDEIDKIKSIASSIESIRDTARAKLVLYQSVICDVDLMDGVVEGIGSEVTGAAIELGAAADLPDKAKACEAKVDCPQVTQIEAALQIGDIDKAKPLIDQLKTQGCLSAAALEDEYWRVAAKVRPLLDGARNAFSNLATTCDYLAARKAAEELQDAFPQHPWIVENLRSIQQGAIAQIDVKDQLQKALSSMGGLTFSYTALGLLSADKSQGDIAAGDQAVAQAEKIAAPFPCLAKVVANFKNGFENAKTLAEKIASLRARINELTAKRTSAQTHVDTAKDSADQAAQLLTQLYGYDDQLSSVGNKCQMASTLKGALQALASDADNSEQTIRANLDQAINAMTIDPSNGTVNNCAAAADMQAKYNQAIKDVGQVGADAKQARQTNEGDLRSLLSDIGNAQGAYGRTNELADSLADACEKVAAAVDATTGDVEAGQALKANFTNVAAGLRAEIDKLRSDNPSSPLDADINQLYALLDSATADSQNVSFDGIVDAAAAQATRCEGIRSSGQAQMQKYQSEIACSVAPADDLVTQMDNTVYGLGIELAAAADASQKASACLVSKTTTPAVASACDGCSTDVPDALDPSKPGIPGGSDTTLATNVPDALDPNKPGLPSSNIPDVLNPGNPPDQPTSNIPDVLNPGIPQVASNPPYGNPVSPYGTPSSAQNQLGSGNAAQPQPGNDTTDWGQALQGFGQALQGLAGAIAGINPPGVTTNNPYPPPNQQRPPANYPPSVPRPPANPPSTQTATSSNLCSLFPPGFKNFESQAGQPPMRYFCRAEWTIDASRDYSTQLTIASWDDNTSAQQAVNAAPSQWLGAGGAQPHSTTAFGGGSAIELLTSRGIYVFAFRRGCTTVFTETVVMRFLSAGENVNPQPVQNLALQIDQKLKALEPFPISSCHR